MAEMDKISWIILEMFSDLIRFILLEICDYLGRIIVVDNGGVAVNFSLGLC